MYRLSYEKCFCFIFLVILVFLSCSGFHTDRLGAPAVRFGALPLAVDGGVAAVVRALRPPEPGAAPALPTPEPRRRSRRWHARHVAATSSSTSTSTTSTTTTTTTTTPSISERAKRAAGRPRPSGGMGRRERTFCPGQDAGTLAYNASTVVQGRVRSRTAPSRRDRYAITLVVKEVLKDRSGFRPLHKNETIRLHWATPRAGHDCDGPHPDGLVRAHLANGKTYIFFLDRLGTHNYTARGLPAILRPDHQQDAKLRLVKSALANNVTAAHVQPLENTKVRVDGKLRLTCKVRGTPPPVVHWYKDGRQLNAGKQARIRIKYMKKKSVLVIKKARSEDAGTYECRAQGVRGPAASTSATVTLLPRDKPTHTDTPTHTASEGSRKCNLTANQVYCLNGGTCSFFESLGEYICSCAEGFNGVRCGNKVVMSNSSMYRHSSYCSLGQSNTYYC